MSELPVFDSGTQREIFEVSKEAGKPLSITRQQTVRTNLGIDAIRGTLRDSLSDSAADGWLVSKNAFLDGRRPIEELLAGNSEEVHGAVEAFQAGYYL